MTLVVYHLAADKYRSFTRRLSQKQKGLEERALTMPQPSSHLRGCPVVYLSAADNLIK